MPAAWLARLRPLRPLLAVLATELTALLAAHLCTKHCVSFWTRGSAWCSALRSVRDSAESAQTMALAAAVAWLASALATG